MSIFKKLKKKKQQHEWVDLFHFPQVPSDKIDTHIKMCNIMISNYDK